MNKLSVRSRQFTSAAGASGVGSAICACPPQRDHRLWIDQSNSAEPAVAENGFEILFKLRAAGLAVP